VLIIIATLLWNYVRVVTALHPRELKKKEIWEKSEEPAERKDIRIT